MKALLHAPTVWPLLTEDINSHIDLVYAQEDLASLLLSKECFDQIFSINKMQRYDMLEWHDIIREAARTPDVQAFYDEHCAGLDQADPLFMSRDC